MTKPQAALTVVEDVDPVDPLRLELSAAIADRSARQEDVTSARQAVDRLKALVEKAEGKRSSASVAVEFEREDFIGYLNETAKSRAPESMPLSPARRDLALATEEAATAKAAFEIAQSRRSKADAELAAAAAKVEKAISALLAKDLPKRIEDAEKLHDQFMAASSILDEIVKSNEAALPEDVARRLRILRLEGQSLQFFDHELAFGPARAWVAARKALRDDCNTALPD